MPCKCYYDMCLDTDFTEVLKKPFYGRIRDTLFSENEFPNRVLKADDDVFHKVLKQKDITIVDSDLEHETVITGQLDEHSTSKCNDVKDQGSVSETEEIEKTRKLHEDTNDSSGLLVDGKKETILSPEVNKALGTLEKTRRSSFSYAMNDTMGSTLAQNTGIEGELKNADARLVISEACDMVKPTEKVEFFSSKCSRVKVTKTENLPPTATRTTTHMVSKKLAYGVEETKNELLKTPATVRKSATN
ncbi:hypothetical protein Tco_1310584 [Tanacetum coccineum]